MPARIHGDVEADAALNVLIAPDSFKGSLDAAAVASELARGWADVRPQDRLERLPMADGGEGTIDAVAAALPGSLRSSTEVAGPDGGTVTADWLLTPDGTGVIEVAKTSGITLSHLRDPLGATTTGLGQIIRVAMQDPRTKRIWVCLGGSATTDGGAGALQALGVRLLNGSKQQIPPGGGGLIELETIDSTGLVSRGIDIQCLVDVTTPLLGPRGTATMFAPQKGASPDDVRRLERAIGNFAKVAGADPDRPGAGAAGGTAFGLMAVCDAAIVGGANSIGQLLGLGTRIARADLVITGEGRFDEQSLHGKVVGHVIELGGRCETEVGLVAGQIDASRAAFASALALTELAGSPHRAMADPKTFLRAAGRSLAAGWRSQPQL